MICFSEGGHYLAFFRRIAMKYDHVVDISTLQKPGGLKSESRRLRDSVEAHNEWIQYNDSELKFVTKNYPGVIELCIENNFFPTVVFYEKYQEEDGEYESKKAFNLNLNTLEELVLQADSLDRIAKAPIEDLYDVNELEQQRLLLEQFSNSMKQNLAEEIKAAGASMAQQPASEEE